MHQYESGIKCKYCAHFEARTNDCYIGTMFDSELNEDEPHKYQAIRITSPESRCSSFILPVYTGMIHSSLGPPQRNDGSWIVQLSDVPGLEVDLKIEESRRKHSSGCYVATCVYGSYDCPQVWTLRRFRDEYLAKSALGRAFIRAYYAISPKIVEAVGNTAVFRNFFRPILDRFVTKLNGKGYENTPYNDKQW